MTYIGDAISIGVLGVLFDLLSVGNLRTVCSRVVDPVFPKQVVDIEALIFVIVVDDVAACPNERTEQPVKGVQLPANLQVVSAEGLFNLNHVDVITDLILKHFQYLLVVVGAFRRIFEEVGGHLVYHLKLMRRLGHLSSSNDPAYFILPLLELEESFVEEDKHTEEVVDGRVRIHVVLATAVRFLWIRIPASELLSSMRDPCDGGSLITACRVRALYSRFFLSP
jgi:hypothetical protein